MKDDINSLSHSKWNCKYHIVFVPKYRKRAIYGQLKKDIGKILRQLCEFKEVKIIKGEMCQDHVHMLVEIPPKISVASFMGYLKGKSTLRIFEKYSNLKYKFGKREFWCIGYYVDTVGKNEKVIKLVRYYKTLDFADKLRLAINIFESDYINIKSDKMLDILKQILKIVDTNYNKCGMINILEYRHLLLISAQVMEMTEKEQSDFVYEVLADIYNIIKM